MRKKIYGSKLIVVSRLCRMRIWLIAYAICDFLKKSDGCTRPSRIIKICLLNDLYARTLSILLILSAPDLMSPCTERDVRLLSSMLYNDLHWIVMIIRWLSASKRRKLGVSTIYNWKLFGNNLEIFFRPHTYYIYK